MALTGRIVTVGSLLEAGVGIIQRQGQMVGAYALVTLVEQLVQHAEASAKIGGAVGTGAITLVVTIAGFILHLLILREIFLRERLMTADTPLLWGTYIGTSIVIALATMLGMMLLVVPGIIILMRWYLAPYFVLARGTNFKTSLAASRDATAGHRWTLFFTLLVFGLVFGGGLLALVLAAGGFAAYNAIVWYSAIGLTLIVAQMVFAAVSIALTIGIFASFVDGASQYEEVFG